MLTRTGEIFIDDFYIVKRDHVGKITYRYSPSYGREGAIVAEGLGGYIMALGPGTGFIYQDTFGDEGVIFYPCDQVAVRRINLCPMEVT